MVVAALVAAEEGKDGDGNSGNGGDGEEERSITIPATSNDMLMCMYVWNVRNVDTHKPRCSLDGPG